MAAAPAYCWGGDGSDPMDPVRAYVEAALLVTDRPYAPPLDALLQIGNALERERAAAQIAALELTQDHVPELVRMTRDRALHTALRGSVAIWAPIHALHALERLDVSMHVADLLPLFDLPDDWYGNDAPKVLARAGAAALGPLRAHLFDSSRWLLSRSSACDTLVRITRRDPALREPVLAILLEALDMAEQSHPYFNGIAIWGLLDIQALEALPAIRRVFELDAVNEDVAGDWAEVLGALGQPIDPGDALVQHSRRRWDIRREIG